LERLKLAREPVNPEELEIAQYAINALTESMSHTFDEIATVHAALRVRCLSVA